MPVAVSVMSPTAWEIPKSVILAEPSSVIKTLPGLTSRCTMPTACAATNADATSAPIRWPPEGYGALLVQQGTQTHRRHELHDQAGMPSLVDDVVQRHCVRVVQTGSDPGFPDDPVPCDHYFLLRKRRLVEQLLHRNTAQQQFVPALPDQTHPAHGYLIDQPIAPSDHLSHRRHRRHRPGFPVPCRPCSSRGFPTSDTAGPPRNQQHMTTSSIPKYPVRQRTHTTRPVPQSSEGPGEPTSCRAASSSTFGGRGSQV